MRTKTRRSRVARLTAALAVLVVPAGLALPTSEATASGSNSLTVRASEYTYKVAGHPKTGWTQINFENAGVEDHMMAVVPLKPGVTLKQLKQAAMSSDQNTAFAEIAAPGAGENGPSGFPDLLGPKQATSTITQVPAGHYGMLCYVPAPDGTPHFMKGMTRVFDVAKGKSSLKPPTDGVTDVSISDSAISFSADNVGRHLTLKVTNDGQDVHSFTFVKIADGKTLDDVKNYFDAFFSGQPPAGDPPGVIVGGIASIDPGKAAYLEQTLERGHYGYVSTQGDAPNDDYSKGLHGEFEVK